MQNEYFPFINLPLPYEYDALEPFIDQKTMFLHHTRHLQTYIDNLNKALDPYPELQALPLTTMLRNISEVPAEIRQSIRNNGGGVFNHRFYFDMMENSNSPNNQPSGNLASAIHRTFGDYRNFQSKFKEIALAVFGSGYTWLVLDNGNLVITTTANQNTPLEQGLEPILVIDVWEHAYYLKHYNLRADYIDNWFQVIDWKQAEQNYYEAMIMSF